MVDRVKAVIYLNNLSHNFKLIKEVHHHKRVMAIVKADAYGHGAVKISKHLESIGCDFFAVTDLLEAIELRDAGIQSDILIFGKTSPEHIEEINKYNLTQTIDAFDYAKSLNDCQTVIKTHVIIDTGMSRFGIYCHQDKDISKASDELGKILSLNHLLHQGIYTHFAAADEEKEVFTKLQYDIFIKLTRATESKGFNLGLKHCSNSAGILKYNDRQLDMVRAGIALYGYPPIITDLNFLPVMNVFAKVISIRDLDIGDGVSYGITYAVKKPMRIASIAIGYADGYSRLFSNQDYFVYNKKKLNVLGRVCMGVTMVDVTDVDISVGDFIEVFGQNKSLEEMANKINTITYELLTNMSKKRVVFDYIN